MVAANGVPCAYGCDFKWYGDVCIDTHVGMDSVAISLCDIIFDTFPDRLENATIKQMELGIRADNVADGGLIDDKPLDYGVALGWHSQGTFCG